MDLNIVNLARSHHVHAAEHAEEGAAQLEILHQPLHQGQQEHISTINHPPPPPPTLLQC